MLHGEDEPHGTATDGSSSDGGGGDGLVHIYATQTDSQRALRQMHTQLLTLIQQYNAEHGVIER